MGCQGHPHHGLHQPPGPQGPSDHLLLLRSAAAHRHLRNSFHGLQIPRERFPVRVLDIGFGSPLLRSMQTLKQDPKD